MMYESYLFTLIVSGIIFGIGGGFQEMCFACAQELVPNEQRFKVLGKSPPRAHALTEPQLIQPRIHDSR